MIDSRPVIQAQDKLAERRSMLKQPTPAEAQTKLLARRAHVKPAKQFEAAALHIPSLQRLRRGMGQGQGDQARRDSRGSSPVRVLDPAAGRVGGKG